MLTAPPKNIVVLASGSGSNFQALANQPEIRPYISALICNRPGAGCLSRAADLGIATRTLDHQVFDDRESFDSALGDVIEETGAEWIVLSGFMRILGDAFMQRFEGKILNIHPSLLPKYKGLNTHQRAIDAGDTEAGVTVHWATAELDGGPLIAQRKVRIDANDCAESLREKVLIQEHQLYPAVISALIHNELDYEGGHTLFQGNEIKALDLF
jgi:phosphoribosylglycinamide formyltransferase 1